MSGSEYVISWCLYVDPMNMERLAEYLVGLKCNKVAAVKWFPGWKLRLFISPDLRKHDALWVFVTDVCGSDIEIVDCEPDKHPMIERFSVLYDRDVHVCIVRDVDSILSKTDADLVNKWINDDRYDVLQYSELRMRGKCMGGGVAFKRPTVLPPPLPNMKIAGTTGRNHDEPVLWRLIQEVATVDRIQTFLTRMTTIGTYHCYQSEDIAPKDCLVLWPVPFFQAQNGYAQEILGKVLKLDDHVNFAMTYQVLDEHIQAPSSISAKHEWCR